MKEREERVKGEGGRVREMGGVQYMRGTAKRQKCAITYIVLFCFTNTHPHTHSHHVHVNGLATLYKPFCHLPYSHVIKLRVCGAHRSPPAQDLSYRAVFSLPKLTN